MHFTSITDRIKFRDGLLNASLINYGERDLRFFKSALRQFFAT